MIEPLSGLALLYLLSCYGLHLYSHNELYKNQASSYEDDTWDDLLKLDTPSGNRITALYLKHPNPKQTVLFHHGNRADIGLCYGHAKGFFDRGYSVLIFDYPGYGTSEGHPSEHGIYESSLTAYQYLTQTAGVQPKDVLIVGRSLGGGPATHLAMKVPAGGLILESTFTSAYDTRFPARFILGDKFKNRQKIHRVGIPVLIIHGTEDDVTPFSHAKHLYDRVKGPRHCYWIEGAGHIHYQETSNYWSEIDRFSAAIQAGQSALDSA